MVATPFFDTIPTSGGLEADDVAESVLWVSRPTRVDVNELLVRPTEQQT